MNIQEIAGQLYERYCKSVGGFAFNGDKLPSWKEFSTDKSKEKQYLAWIDVAKLSVDIFNTK